MGVGFYNIRVAHSLDKSAPAFMQCNEFFILPAKISGNNGDKSGKKLNNSASYI
jgi:hypothetical protein